MELTYKLHEAQLRILSDKARFKVLVAGRRFGKTILALTTIIVKALQKKSKIWLVAPTYKQAEMIAWKMLQEMIPKELIVKKNEVKLELNLINGSEISLKGADNEDALRGVGLDFVVLDEYAQMKANVFQEIIRPMLTDTKGGALFIGTPKGKNTFFELYLKGRRHQDGFKSWIYKTADNPFIDKAEVEDARKQLNQTYFRQEYEASFEDFVGLIYPEFVKEHIIEPHYIDAMFPRIGAIDPAISGTTGVIKAYINEDGIITVYDEYYQADRRVSDVAPEIKEKGVSWFIDPASHSKNIRKDGMLYSLYDEYREVGIVARPAENDVDAGINRVGEYFKKDKIKIFSSCKNLLSELGNYHWAEERETVAGMVKPRPYKANDHLCDALRYLVMSRPHGEKIEIKPIMAKHSVAWFLEEDERKQNNWRAKWQN